MPNAPARNGAPWDHDGVSTAPRSRVSARLAAIAPSATLAVDAKAKALKAAGRPVIGFGAGEPDFPTPDYIVEAAVAATKDPANHKYSPAKGLPVLREAIAAKTLRDSGYAVSPDDVLVTNGGKQAVFQAFASVVDPGDEVARRLGIDPFALRRMNAVRPGDPLVPVDPHDAPLRGDADRGDHDRPAGLPEHGVHHRGGGGAAAGAWLRGAGPCACGAVHGGADLPAPPRQHRPAGRGDRAAHRPQGLNSPFPKYPGVRGRAPARPRHRPQACRARDQPARP